MKPKPKRYKPQGCPHFVRTPAVTPGHDSDCGVESWEQTEYRALGIRTELSRSKEHAILGED